MDELMKSMRSAESRQIDEENRKMIADLDREYMSSTDKHRTRLLTNVLGHIFQTNLEWNGITAERFRSVEQNITEKWRELTPKYTSDSLTALREAHIKRLTKVLDSQTRQLFVDYCYRILPIVPK